MQRSFSALREAAERYETAATKHQWAEVFERDAKVEELREMADGGSRDEAKGKFQSGFDKFGSVALEYSKLLDMILNQAPVYAAIAWGVVKLLLVAHVNHARLKHNVGDVLISIGEKAALINHFVFYNPTAKMAEGVGLLFAAFTRFLETAIHYYTKSKLGRSLGSLVSCVER